MKELGVVLTIAASIFAIPVLFLTLSVVSYTLVIPLFVSFLDATDVPRGQEGRVFLEKFIGWLALPFTASIQAVKLIHQDINQKLGGIE